MKIYSATVKQPDNYESKLENASLEDAKAWVSLMFPDAMSGIDWDKLGVYDFHDGKFSITASEQDSPVDESEPEDDTVDLEENI